MTQKKFYKSLYLLLIISIISFFVTACSKPNSTGLNTTKIGISWTADKIDEDAQLYADAVKKAGGEPIFLPQFKNQEDAKKALEGINAVIVTGGDDLNPELYGEAPIPQLEEINKARDTSDVVLLKECFDKDIPTLATCRGMQLTNILCGGTLYQDIDTQRPTDIIHRDPNKEIYVKHEAIFEKDNIISDALGLDGKFEVNSWHHQAIKDLGKNLKVVATAPDGTIEAIVKVDNSYFIGLQWHPEEMISQNNDRALNLYKALVAQADKNLQNNKNQK